jgi:hypothetical protein
VKLNQRWAAAILFSAVLSGMMACMVDPSFAGMLIISITCGVFGGVIGIMLNRESEK